MFGQVTELSEICETLQDSVTLDNSFALLKQQDQPEPAALESFPRRTCSSRRSLYHLCRAVGGQLQVGTHPLSGGRSVPPRLHPLLQISSLLPLSVIVNLNLSSPYLARLPTSELFKFSTLDPRGDDKQHRDEVWSMSRGRGVFSTLPRGSAPHRRVSSSDCT